MKQIVATCMLLLIGCTGRLQPPAEPDDLIPANQMVEILTEMMVLESHMQQRFQHVSNFYKAMLVSGDACLKRHHVTKDQYERSFRYYISHQTELQAIYTRVMDKLSRKSAEMTAKSMKKITPVKTEGSAIADPVTSPFKR